MRRRLIGEPGAFLALVWIVATMAAATWVASQFASNSPCRFDESKAFCHGRRIGEANPLALLAILLGWVLVAIVLPRWLQSRRSNGDRS